MRIIIISIFLFVLIGFTKVGFAGYCINATKGFKNSLTINRILRDLADNSSGFAVVGSIGPTSGGSGGEAGERQIAALLITEKASWDSDTRKPTVIITGAIHGNEWATSEVSLGIAEYLLENKDNKEPARDDKGVIINEKIPQTGMIVPTITSISELLETIQVVVIPVFNPDGYDFSCTPDGRKSYYGVGWRPNRQLNFLTGDKDVCYREDGSHYADLPTKSEHCFLADYDDTALGGELEEEEAIVCESINKKTLSLFEPSLNISSEEMFDAIYTSTNPLRVVCASNQRRIWKSQWSIDEVDSVNIEIAKVEGYLQDSYGVDLNRNFQYKWDVTENQKHLFIRTRSPSSRMYRGDAVLSERETAAMERFIDQRNVVALIDYHSGSTQVLYPYAYSTTSRANKNLLGSKWDKGDYEVFRQISRKISFLLNRHDRGDESITNYSAAQNYNDVSVGSGVARDCYYQMKGIAALNIEVHDKGFTYEHEEFKRIVPEICKTNIPGAVWFLFWAADLMKK